MKQTYEATYILDIQSKEEIVKEYVDLITKDIKSLDGTVTGTQKLDRRRFERSAGKLDTGYYLVMNFELDSSKIGELEDKYRLNKTFYRQFYLKTKPKKQPSEKKEVAESAA
ncbi:MAG: 30S ribosomal protein S6 [Verrucomicrobiota bacterium]